MSRKTGRGFVCFVRLAAIICAGIAVRPAWGGPSPTKVYWTGAQDDFWNTTSTDWLLFGNPSDYSDGDDVFFQDAPGNYNVSLVGTLSPAEIVVDNDLLPGVGNLPGGTTADAADGGNYVVLGTGNIGAVASSLIKTGAGSLTFANTTANLYTGSTNLYEGTLALDFSSTLATNLISPSSTLNLGGGELSIVGASGGASAQNFNNTTLLSGASEVVVNSNGGTGTTINLGLISQSAGGTVNFYEPTPATSTITASNTLTSGIIGGWATFGATIIGGSGNWATLNGSNDIVPLTTYVNDTWGAGNNTNVTTSSSPAPNSTTNSLRYGSPSGESIYNITLSGTLNTITSGGILFDPDIGENTISGSALTSGTSELDVNSWGGGYLDIDSQIVDNPSHPIGLTFSGTGGELRLTNTSNTYSGVTTVNGDIFLYNLSNGGSPSSIGESSNAAANLIINGGEIIYQGAGFSTDRLLTLGPAGGYIRGQTFGAMQFTDTGPIAFSDSQAVNGYAAAVTFGLSGNDSPAISTFAPLLQDPGTGQNLLDLSIGGGTWSLTNSNTYSGGTTVSAGVLLAGNSSGSATGSGPVIVKQSTVAFLPGIDELGNSAPTIGGGGSIGGPVTVQSGGYVDPSADVPNGATNFTINNTLNLNTGTGLIYDLNIPNSPGVGGGNDLTTVNGAVTINQNLTLDVNPQASFGAGTYALVHYNSIVDGSNSFSGRMVNPQSVPPGLGAGQFETFSFSNDAVHDNVILTVATSGSAPTLGSGQSTTTVQQANTVINNSAVSNPIVNILGGAGGNTGAGGGTNTGFYLARGPQTGAKAFSFGWAPLLVQLAPGTPYFVPSGVQVGDPAQTGIPVSPNGPYTTNPPFNPAGTGKVSIGGKVVGANYPAGTNPPSAAPDDWVPAFYLAPLIIVVDPPATPTPTYYGESFTNPNELNGIFLADQVTGQDKLPGQMSGEDVLPGEMDSLSAGSDDAFDYQGSFLSLVQSDFPSITDLSQLSDTQWSEFDGSYGVDSANDIAWSVNDVPSADYTVIGILPEPGSLGLLAIASVGLMARRVRWAHRWRRRAMRPGL